MSLLKRIYCFLFGHKTLPVASRAMCMIDPDYFDGSCHLQVCLRCKQLWGNIVPSGITVISIKEEQALEKKLADGIAKAYEATISPPPRFLESVEFLLSELSDQTVKVKVLEDKAFGVEEVEIVTAEGKTSMWAIEFPQNSQTVDELELAVHEQLGNVLNKVKDPVSIKVSPTVFNYIDYPMKGVIKSMQNTFNSLGGLFAGTYGQGQTKPQAGNAQGTIQGQGVTGKSTTGTGSGS